MKLSASPARAAGGGDAAETAMGPPPAPPRAPPPRRRPALDHGQIHASSSGSNGSGRPRHRCARRPPAEGTNATGTFRYPHHERGGQPRTTATGHTGEPFTPLGQQRVSRHARGPSTATRRSTRRARGNRHAHDIHPPHAEKRQPRQHARHHRHTATPRTIRGERAEHSPRCVARSALALSSTLPLRPLPLARASSSGPSRVMSPAPSVNTTSPAHRRADRVRDLFARSRTAASPRRRGSRRAPRSSAVTPGSGCSRAG